MEENDDDGNVTRLAGPLGGATNYTYDDMGRVKSVSLNGVDDYVTYNYSGEHTNTEKVTATMADGTVATTTKNAYGNVTKSTCGVLLAAHGTMCLFARDFS